MTHNEFDKEYYVISPDGANNHPLLNWGETSYAAFRKKEIIDEATLDFPLKIIFDQPYPKQPYEMADFSILGAQRAGSEKLKQLFSKLNVYGVQFIPIEVESNKSEIIAGHYALNFWNRLRAIDKNNYEGSEPNRFGNILSLHKFSLDYELLNNTPFEKRLVFGLEENNMVIVHKNIYEAIINEKLAGIKLFPVSEWNDGASFQ